MSHTPSATQPKSSGARRCCLAVLVAVGGAAVVLSACSNQGRDSEVQRSTPFVFQALNLRQQDSQGRLLWLVTSPEARYDLSRRLAQARNLRGEIHTNGQALYRLEASHGTVLSDGAVIQLEGQVTIQRLGRDPVTIEASRMRWYPRQQRIELDRRAAAFDQSLKLTASKATLLLDRDLLQLRGQPQLQSRQPLSAGDGQLRLRLQQVDWSPGSGVLRAPGPVNAVGTTASGVSRRLQSAGLMGNTVARRLELLAPVRVQIPDRQAWLNAQGSTIDFNSRTVSSSAPLTAAVGPLQISGQAWRLLLDSGDAEILAGCRLAQPDLSLAAQRCRWNWRSERIGATGDVVLKRQANRQTTRAQTLRGRIGKQGLLVFSAPGSRVRSTLVLPQGSPAGTPKAAAIRW